jgi:hypothetical protein
MPNDPVVSDTQFYKVVPEQDVMLRVEVGDSQDGGTSVTVDGNVQLITSGTLSLGAGSTLVRKLAHCITTVKDVSPDTNRTDVTYVLSGGADGEQRFSYGVSVAADGGFARYFIDFAFI